ncbi:HAMP domain-containing sensor histidine kinase [Marinobacteraceae bacterium S3BR75-40.1]
MRPRSLHGRLALTFLFFALGTGLVYAWLTLSSVTRLHQEVSQSLHRNLAAYIRDHLPEPLLEAQGEVDDKVLQSLAMNVMAINPMVEVYLLDPHGRILGHALGEGSVTRRTVDLEPVRRFLRDPGGGVILGDDPRSAATRKIFSAAALGPASDPQAYLYVVLAGMDAEKLEASLGTSHVLRTLLWGGSLVLLLGLAAAALAFSRLTRPLRRLTRDMQAFQAREGDGLPAQEKGNEIDLLQRTFEQMRAQIRHQLAQLEDTDRLRRELISNVSHDLRTPTASMQGYLETLILKDETLTPEQRRHYLGIAHRHSIRLSRLISQLFELSKLEAGRVTPEEEPFELAELLGDIVQEYQLPAEKRGLGLRMEPPAEPLRVRADIALIERVLQNLIDNAMRHTPKGGEVVLSLHREGESVDVRVTDTGSGIDPQVQTRIFDRYYHEASDTKDSVIAPSGLGLAIVQRILQLHGREIRVDSRRGEGACFHFSLPLQA